MPSLGEPPATKTQDRTPARHDGRRLWSVGIALLLTAGLLVAHRPWAAAPFGIFDFADFLPRLRAGGSVGQTAYRLTQEYVGQGRFNVVTYGALALKWHALGPSPEAWHIARALQMIGLNAIVFVLLRRLRVTSAGAIAGTAAFALAEASTSAWTWLTMGEPLGVGFVLVAAILATGYRETRRPRTAAAAIVILLGLAILTKEMFIASVPFVALIAAGTGNGERSVRSFLRERRALELLAGLCGMTLLVALPILAAAATAPPTSFASGYGLHNATAARGVAVVAAFTAPWELRLAAGADPRTTIAATAYWCVVVLGLLAAGRRQPQHARRVLLAATLAVPFAIVYLPWPYIQRFYALPPLVGQALLVGSTWDVLATTSRLARGLSAALFVTAGFLGLLQAESTAARSRAFRLATMDLATALVPLPPHAGVIVAEAAGHPAGQERQSYGATLGRFLRATHGSAAPVVRGGGCAQLRHALLAPESTSQVGALAAGDCQRLPPPDTVIRREAPLLLGRLLATDHVAISMPLWRPHDPRARIVPAMRAVPVR